MKHTKGKWEVIYVSGIATGVGIKEENISLSGTYWEAIVNTVLPKTDGEYEDSNIEANAKLIAAAPELLEACNFEELYSELMSNEVKMPARIRELVLQQIRNSREAIKKATE